MIAHDGKKHKMVLLAVPCATIVSTARLLLRQLASQLAAAPVANQL
ncbi:hypothetical protein [uncultured Sphaerotilus sp.]